MMSPRGSGGGQVGKKADLVREVAWILHSKSAQNGGVRESNNFKIVWTSFVDVSSSFSPSMASFSPASASTYLGAETISGGQANSSGERAPNARPESRRGEAHLGSAPAVVYGTFWRKVRWFSATGINTVWFVGCNSMDI